MSTFSRRVAYNVQALRVLSHGRKAEDRTNSHDHHWRGRGRTSLLPKHEEGDDPLGYMVWPWPSTQHGYEVAGEAQGHERVQIRPRFRTPMHKEVVIQRVIAARLYTEPLRRPSRVVRAMRYGLRPDGRDLRRGRFGGKKVYHRFSTQWLRRAADTFSWDSMVALGDPWALGSQGIWSRAILLRRRIIIRFLEFIVKYLEFIVLYLGIYSRIFRNL